MQEARYLKIRGLEAIHVKPSIVRSKRPIFGIHGAWCTALTLQPIMEMCSEIGYESYTISLPGHGGSKLEGPLGSTSIELYNHEVMETIKEIGEKVVILGHSMGAIVGSTVSRMAQGRVKGFIGITSGPPRGVLVGLKAMRRTTKYLRSILNEEEFMLNKEDAYDLIFNRIPRNKFEELYSTLVNESGRAIKETLLWKYEMKKLHCPALVIGAKYDNMTPHQDKIARMLGARNPVMVECCHAVPYDPNVGQVIRAIHSWMTSEDLYSF